MDALKNIIANVPDWLKRLDDLGIQIDQRQAELAALGVSSTKSIKNRGSTESLKLKDVADADVSRDADQVGDVRETTPPREDKQDAAQPPSPNASNTPSAIQRQTQQATLDALHLLALVERRDIWSLRDLRRRHLPWLRHMRARLVEATTAQYPSIDDDQLKLYVHYQPTYHHFHVHIVHVQLEAGATQATGKAAWIAWR
ncbi:hypothetical protein BN1723_005813 [Verticillium longisporum]|uniref:HIT domain-containing protein n=1 Tax=Verticillium longisporum TaxID=100787 RepID=A0A0G4NBG9_VERLO|nr:hypothetical protein BN1723_005813 [Verticillium longisporum]